MDLKKINEELQNLLEEDTELTETGVLYQGFLNYVKEKGYTIKETEDADYILIDDLYIDVHIIGFVEGDYRIAFIQRNYRGYPQQTDRSPKDFNTVEEYYAHALDQIKAYAKERKDAIEHHNNIKKAEKQRIDDLNAGKQITATLEEASRIINKLKQSKNPPKLIIQIAK